MPSATTLLRDMEEAAVAWSLTASPTHLPTPSRRPAVMIHAPGDKRNREPENKDSAQESVFQVKAENRNLENLFKL